MVLRLDTTLAGGLNSNLQKTRAITEGWIGENMSCPICGEPRLFHHKNNEPVADFYCNNCGADFELKSSKRKSSSMPRKIGGGAYQKMVERLTSVNSPNLFVMTYFNYKVNNLILVPSHFFTLSVVEKRNPLSSTAVRAGWIGSNIVLGDIPDIGKIYLVRNGVEEDPRKVRTLYQESLSLYEGDLDSRGWLLDVWKCIETIPTDCFYLKHIYSFVDELKKKHPGNHHIKDKIRQQLQILRDKGFIVFVSRGLYKKIGIPFGTLPNADETKPHSMADNVRIATEGIKEILDSEFD